MKKSEAMLAAAQAEVRELDAIERAAGTYAAMCCEPLSDIYRELAGPDASIADFKRFARAFVREAGKVVEGGLAYGHQLVGERLDPSAERLDG